MCYAEVAQAWKKLLLVFKTSFTNIKSSEIKSLIKFDWQIKIFFFVSAIWFDCQTQSMDFFNLIWYQYSLIEFDWLCQV